MSSPELCRRFSLDEYLSANQNFNKALVVGDGGFRRVYKATIRKMQDRLNHVAAQIKSLYKDNINCASMSKDKRDDHLELSSAGNIQTLAYDLKKFSFSDLKKATRDFTRRLGGGEFGEVFEGCIEFKTRNFKNNTSSLFVDNGILRIAIKRLYHSTIQCHPKEKFVDMRFSRKLNHPNLVKVLGYCFQHKKLFLVYEFMENGSLDSHLFTKDRIPLPWETRVRIAVGIAEALWFLHITHTQADNFSIRINQILLDENFNPKISAYESAKIVHGGSKKERIILPLHYHPQQSKNSEFEGSVRSFGVLLIEIITGEHISKIDIANLRKNMWNPEGEHRKESLRRVLDPRLSSVDDPTIMETMKLALDCLVIPNFPLEKALHVLRQLKSDVRR